MTNITGEATITIGRPANEAWDYVADPANLHTWVKNIDSPGNWLDGGGPDVGSRYRIDYNYGRNTNEIIFEDCCNGRFPTQHEHRQRPVPDNSRLYVR